MTTLAVLSPAFTSFLILAPVEPPPAPPAQAGAVQTGPVRSAAVDAAFGTPPAGAEFDPGTQADPGFVERGQTRGADRTYGSTARSIGPDGQVIGGLQITDDPFAGDQPTLADEVPEFHTVQEGDTLWDISSFYFHDPYMWPKVWSWNEHITNAHWIFPGDRIRLFDPNQPRRRARAQETDRGLRFSRTKTPERTRRDPYLLNQFVFVDAKDFETSMKVVGGAEAAVMMGTLDTLYMDYDRGNPPIPGERLMVYAPTRKVWDTKRKNVLGYIVQVMGEVEVGDIARKTAEGLVVNSLNPIERGYRVGPLRRQFRRVEPTEASRSASGEIVMTLNSTGPIRLGKNRKKPRKGKQELLAGEEQFVITDLGKADGVELGNVLEVVRKGDEYTPKRVFHIPYEDGWPRRVIGTVLVVDVQDETSLGVVTYARRELERGDHVELRGPGLDGREGQAESDRGRLEAEAEGKVQTGNGKAKASGGFKLGGSK